MHNTAPRLADLTQHMANRSQIVAATQLFWLAAKHRGSRPLMLQEAQNMRIASTELAKILMAAVPGADTTTAGWASELVPNASFIGEWVKSVTSQTILGQLPYMRAPFDTRTIADVTPGSAAWVEQGEPIPMTRLTYAATGALVRKKVAAMVPITDESLELWNAAVQQNLEDLIGRVVRLTIDRTLIDPDQGVTDARPASLTNGITSSQSTGSTAAQALADLKAALGPVLASSADPSRVRIIMSPTTALHLSQLLTTGGSYAFGSLGAFGGAILGVPVIVSPAAVFIGSPSANLVVVVDASRILVADDGVMDVAASSIATLQFTDAPASGPTTGVSLYQTNTTALRLCLYKNWQRANATAVAWFSVQY